MYHKCIVLQHPSSFVTFREFYKSSFVSESHVMLSSNYVVVWVELTGKLFARDSSPGCATTTAGYSASFRDSVSLFEWEPTSFYNIVT